MSLPDTSPQARKRSPLLLVFGGCAALLLCGVLALAINAGYWVWRMRGNTGADQAPPAEQAQAGLAALPAGDAGRGERIFNGQGECSACHSLEAGQRKVGPSLAGIGERAGATQPGYSSELYLYESILYPQAHVVSGYPGGVMPNDFQQQLDQQALADLIAFLKTR